MRVHYHLLFLTLVLAPTDSFCAPIEKITVTPQPLDTEEDPYLVRQVMGKERNYLLNISLGMAGGNFIERDQYHQGPYLAVRYLPLEEGIPKWDYQAEVTKDNFVGLSVGRRWYCCDQDPYLPYLRLSGNLILQGSDELGGLAAIRRWRLRAAAGIGETFVSEFGVGLSVTGPDLFAQFGFNF